MTLDSIFRIASMTKPITSVAVMQLVENGRVKLDAPASSYLPELSEVQVLEGFDSVGKPALRRPRTIPTVRQLLTHTSGFVYDFDDPSLHHYVVSGALQSFVQGGDGFLKAPLAFDPGSRWEYGIGIDWLGRLVERVSGQTLEAYFREHIFQPLGMKDTFFDVPSDKQERVVAVQHIEQDGSFTQPPPQPFTPATFFSGGGGLYRGISPSKWRRVCLKSFLDPPDQPRKRRLTFITTPPVKRGAFTGSSYTRHHHCCVSSGVLLSSNTFFRSST
jgi:methyl acetate hydrolase